jgi:hypothetical protein
MGMTDKNIQEEIRNQEREEFFQKCKDKEIKNFKKNFTDNYSSVKKLVETVNKFLNGLQEAGVSMIGKDYTYDEFCVGTLRVAEVEVENVDFSLLIMDEQTIDSYAKRELLRNPSIMKTMKPEEFQEHLSKVIPKWAKQRTNTFRNKEIVNFHRNICATLINDKLASEARTNKIVQEKIQEFISSIYSVQKLPETTITVSK